VEEDRIGYDRIGRQREEAPRVSEEIAATDLKVSTKQNEIK
jgi:hypothetical protein